MKRFSQFLFNYFHFNKQERHGIFVLMLIIFVLILVRFTLPYFLSQEPDIQFSHIDLSTLKDTVVENEINSESSLKSDHHPSQEKTFSKFVFDPNGISPEEAIQLGFSEKTAQVLVNYRNKGGKFKQPDDLKKLYGVSEQLFNELKPYILIQATSSFSLTKGGYTSSGNTREIKTFSQKIIELNSADSLSLLALKGIGPALTKRILKYRQMLGGFYTVDQLTEVYGIKDSVLLFNKELMQVDATYLKKISLNSVEFKELKKHPYVTFPIAQAIINFRDKHGKITQQDFMNFEFIPADKKLKLLSYFEFN